MENNHSCGWLTLVSNHNHNPLCSVVNLSNSVTPSYELGIHVLQYVGIVRFWVHLEWVYYCNLGYYTMPYGTWNSILLTWEHRPASELCGEQLCTTTLVPGGRFIPLPGGNKPMGEVWGPHVDPTSCFESEKGRRSRKPCRPQHDGRQWICKQQHNSSWCLSPHDFEARNQSVDVGIAWSGGSLQKSA